MKLKLLYPGLLLLLLPGGFAGADEGETYMPDEQQRQQILAGEVISIPVHTDAKGGTVWGAIRIDAPAQAIFDSIVYCNGGSSAHKSMRNCKTLEKTPEHEIAEHQIKFHWLVPRQTYIFRGDYTGLTKIRFRVVEGDRHDPTQIPHPEMAHPQESQKRDSSHVEGDEKTLRES
jgi:hypothetical protein